MLFSSITTIIFSRSNILFLLSFHNQFFLFQNSPSVFCPFPSTKSATLIPTLRSITGFSSRKALASLRAAVLIVSRSFAGVASKWLFVCILRSVEIAINAMDLKLSSRSFSFPCTFSESSLTASSMIPG